MVPCASAGHDIERESAVETRRGNNSVRDVASLLIIIEKKDLGILGTTYSPGSATLIAMDRYSCTI